MSAMSRAAQFLSLVVRTLCDTVWQAPSPSMPGNTKDSTQAAVLATKKTSPPA